MATVLKADRLCVGYDGHPVVHDLDLEIAEGEVAGLLGPNGAGKTTTILSLAGDLAPISGQLTVDGQPTRVPLHRRARSGTALVTEERSVFMRLSVADNLRVGRCDKKAALSIFPELEPLMRRTAGTLSGGEQQILTLARALARRPRLLLADELSLGLAPLVVARLLSAVRTAATEYGVAAIIVEQHAGKLLRIADRAYVMRRGRIVLTGSAKQVASQIDDMQLSS